MFLSSHLLPEIEQVCTHAAVMSRGKLLAQGTLSDLQAGDDRTLKVEVDDAPAAAGLLERLGLGEVRVTGDTVQAKLGSLAAAECNRELVMAGIAVRSLSTERASLEDRFVALTGEGFDVAR